MSAHSIALLGAEVKVSCCRGAAVPVTAALLQNYSSFSGCSSAEVCIIPEARSWAVTISGGGGDLLGTVTPPPALSLLISLIVTADEILILCSHYCIVAANFAPSTQQLRKFYSNEIIFSKCIQHHLFLLSLLLSSGSWCSSHFSDWQLATLAI